VVAVARERQPEPTSAGLRKWLAERDRRNAADYAAAFGDRDAPLPGLSARADALERGEVVELAGWAIPREARPAHIGPNTWVRVHPDGSMTVSREGRGHGAQA